MILTKGGHVFTCGYGALGLGKEVIQTLEASEVRELSDKQIIKVVATTDYAAAISSKSLYGYLIRKKKDF